VEILWNIFSLFNVVISVSQHYFIYDSHEQTLRMINKIPNHVVVRIIYQNSNFSIFRLFYKHFITSDSPEREKKWIFVQKRPLNHFKVKFLMKKKTKFSLISN